jgi:hypothetical protein
LCCVNSSRRNTCSSGCLPQLSFVASFSFSVSSMYFSETLPSSTTRSACFPKDRHDCFPIQKGPKTSSECCACASMVRAALAVISRLFFVKNLSSFKTAVSSSNENAHGSAPGCLCHRISSNTSDIDFSETGCAVTEHCSPGGKVAVPTHTSSLDPSRATRRAKHVFLYSPAVPASHKPASSTALSVKIFVASPRAGSLVTRRNTRCSSA